MDVDVDVIVDVVVDVVVDEAVLEAGKALLVRMVSMLTKMCK